MAEVGDKLVDIKSLRVVIDALVRSIGEMFDDITVSKLNAPKVNGTIGQVLTLKDDQGNTEWKDMPGNVDVVRQSTHHTDYTKDTLEFVTDSTGKVINVYFISK